MTGTDSLQWYRQPWPWILIALPASSVLACATLIAIALHDPDSLVVDDYYKEGLAINQRLERDRYALQAGLIARGRFSLSEGRLELRLSATRPVATQQCHLRLVHPTRSEYDQNITLRYQAQRGVYVGEFPAELAAGRWHVVLEPADGVWRLTGRVSLPEAREFELAPASS